MIKNAYLLFFSILNYCLLSACSNDPHATIKLIKINKHLNVEWYHSNGLVDYGPDIIEIIGTKKNNIICRGGIICDMKFVSDTLLIITEGSYFIKLNLINEFNLKIKIDTTCSSPYLYRETHKNR